MDFSDNPIDVNSFLGFNFGTLPVALPPLSDEMNSVTYGELGKFPYDVPFADDSGSYFYSTFSLSNVGYYQFQMSTNGRPLAVGGTPYDTYGIVFEQNGGPATPIHYLEVLFRYFPVTPSTMQVSEGEVGLYQGGCVLAARGGTRRI
jgi:hypothetical protein